MTLLYFFTHYLTIPWPTVCKPYEVFYQTASLPLMLWPTVSEWHAIFATNFSSYNKQVVSHNAFVFCQTYYLCHCMMTNSKCVIQHYWYNTTYQSLYIILHNQQEVSRITPYSKTVHEISLWPIESQLCFLAHHYAFTNLWQDVCIAKSEFLLTYSLMYLVLRRTGSE